MSQVELFLFHGFQGREGILKKMSLVRNGSHRRQMVMVMVMVVVMVMVMVMVMVVVVVVVL